MSALSVLTVSMLSSIICYDCCRHIETRTTFMKDLQSPFRAVCVHHQGWVHSRPDYFQTFSCSLFRLVERTHGFIWKANLICFHSDCKIPWMCKQTFFRATSNNEWDFIHISEASVLHLKSKDETTIKKHWFSLCAQFRGITMVCW